METKTLSESKSTLPPYVSYVTFKNTIGTLGEGGLPNQIDASCLPNMAGGTQSQFLVALRSLKLIDLQGKPSPVLGRLASADAKDWSNTMKSILLSIFPRLVEVLKDGTMKQLRDEMGDEVSGSVVEKSIRFLLAAAADADIPVSQAIRKAKLSTRAKSTKGKSTNSEPPPTPPPAPTTDHHKPKHSHGDSTDAWLAKYPNFDPSWPKEIQAQWFEGFAKLMALKEGKHG